MTVVLDASAGIEIILSRSSSQKLIRELSQSKKVVSSDLYKIETANALWKYIQAGLVKPEQSSELLNLAQDLVDEFVDISVNNEEALKEAVHQGHSAYDMLYFTLARRLGARLLTLDKKLNKIAKQAGIDILD